MNEKRRRIRLHAKDPHCHWCGRLTRLVVRDGKHGLKFADDEATLDHLRDRYEGRVQILDGTEVTVLACLGCNLRRSAEATAALAKEALWARCGTYPLGHPLARRKIVMPKTIFVFGSNLRGAHGKGAALEARRKWGARLGVGEGPTGKAYAIPTKDRELKTRPLPDIADSVVRFLDYALEHPELDFLVTAIGCGLAGYKAEQIGPLFRGAPSNVELPDDFRPYATAPTPGATQD